MGLGVLRSLCCLSGFLLIVRAEIDIEIQDFWGSVNFKAGSTEDIVCLVSNSADSDVISWFIDDKKVDNQNRAIFNSADATLEQTFSLKVDYAVSNSTLKCSCRDKEDEIRINVINAVVPEKVTILPIKEGEDAILKTGLELFPAPQAGDVSWKISAPGGVQPIRLEPGHSSIRYKAHKAVISGTPAVNYVYELEISSFGVSDMSNLHTLEIKHNGQVYSVEFSLSLIKENAGDITTETSFVTQPPTSGLGLGVWVALIVITIIVILVVIYCIYKRKKGRPGINTKRPATNDKNDKTQYTEVKTKEEQV